MPPLLRRLSSSLFAVRDGLSQPRTAYCFGHAGATTRWAIDLADLLPPGWGAVVVVPPGRGPRRGDGTRQDLHAEAGAAAAEVAGVHPDGAAAFVYGQSVGALAAFETVVRLEAAGLDVAALVVLGGRAPVCPPPDDEADEAAEAALYAAAVESGLGGDTGLRDDEGLRDGALALLREDMAVFASYDWGNARSVGAPVVAIRGASDPLVGADEVRAWSGATRAEAAYVEVPGGHLPVARAVAAWAAPVDRPVAG